MTMSPEICRLPCLLGRFLMVDGPTRAGKSTVIRIVSSLERVELERIEEIYDYVGFLFGFGKIEKDAAIALLRAFSDIHIYNLYLGRNVNCRPGDVSSIFRSARPLTYLRRMFAEDHEPATDSILSDDPILQQHAHYQMEHIGIHFEAFSNGLKVVEVLRHPVDLVTANIERGYGENVCESLHNVHLGLRNGNTAIHLLAKGWESEFLRMRPHDRVVRMLHGYQMRSFETYRTLVDERRNNIRVIAFEDVIADPHRQAAVIADFLGTRVTRMTGAMIARVGCPRQVSKKVRDEAYADLQRQCTPQSLKLLDEMIANYESRWAC